MADDLEIPGATAGEEVGEYTAIAAGFIPLVGGPIADIAQKAIRDRQNKRLEEFLESLSKKIQEIEDRLNQEFIRKDEAKRLFEEVLQTAEQSTQPQKLEVLQSVLIVTYTSASPSYDTASEMVQLVRDLQPRHLKLLKILADPKAADAALGNPVWGPRRFLHQHQLDPRKTVAGLDGGSDRANMAGPLRQASAKHTRDKDDDHRSWNSAA